MQMTRAAVVTTAAVVVLVTAASGTPLLSVPAGGLGADSPGEGTATVTVVSAPDRVTIEPGRQGGGVYYLRIPDARIEVDNLQGNPLLSYSVDIPALGYKRSAVHLLGNAGEGQLAVSIADDTLEGEEVDRDTYRAEVELILRGDRGERTLYAGNATVEVAG